MSGDFTIESGGDGTVYNYAGPFLNLHVSMPPQNQRMLALVAAIEPREHACCIPGDRFSVYVKTKKDTPYYRGTSKPSFDGLVNDDVYKYDSGVCFGTFHAREWATLLFKLVNNVIPVSSSHLSEAEVDELKSACKQLFEACTTRPSKTGKSGDIPAINMLSLDMHHSFAAKVPASNLTGVDVITRPRMCNKGISCKMPLTFA
jgi:hypothetical protein